MKDLKAHTTKELTVLLGVNEISSVTRRAARENWKSVPRPGRGGGEMWLVSSMPEKTRRELASALAAREARLPSPELEKSLALLAELPDARRARAEGRARLAQAARLYTQTCGLSASAALRDFCAKYNQWVLTAPDDVRAAVPHVSLNSIKTWMRGLEETGIHALAGNYGNRAGSGMIDSQPAMLAYVLGRLAEHPDISATLLYEGIRAHFRHDPEIRIPSERRVQEWLHRWKLDNAQLHTYMAAPDHWRNEFMAACGNAAEKVIRPNQRWEFDGTPSDLILSDGHRYNITGVIDVFTRRLMLLVSPRASSRAVASLTRKAIMEWGVPETPVTDNGKDYVAAHMMQLWAGLNITPLTLPPFRPDLKPFIERSFRTFSHHLLTLLPGYTGANVAERQRIRERKSFAARMMKQGEEIELPFDQKQLQAFCDDWCNHIYAHKKHHGLGGKTPFEMAAAIRPDQIRRVRDESALHILLLPLAPGSAGWRVVGKKGVRAGGMTYNAPELGGLEGKMVQPRLDDNEVGVAYLFGEDGKFICRAFDHDVLGVLRDEVAAVRQNKQKKIMRERAAAMREAKKALRDKPLALEIMEAAKERSAKRIAFTGAELAPEHTSEGLVEAGRAARSGQGLPPITEERARELREMAQAAMRGEGFRPPETSAARYRMCNDILAVIESGQPVEEAEKLWAYNYRTSSEYIGQKLLAETFAPAARQAAIQNAG